MKSEIQKRTDGNVTLKINYDEAGLKPHVATAYDRLRKNLKVPGFRPGHAPDNIIDRELGPNAVQSEVLESAVAESYSAAVREHDLPVIASPEVNILKFVPYTELEFTASVEVMPEIKLTDYKKLKVAKPKSEVTDDEVDQVLKDLSLRMAKKKEADRPAKMGDEAVIDFEGKKGEEKIEGGSASDYPLTLGNASFIPGFEDQIVGMKTGDEKTFDITFPKDYPTSTLAGVKATFKVKLKRLLELEPPAVDDQFAQSVSQFKVLTELKADIKERLREEKAERDLREYENKVLEELVTKSQFKAPKGLIDQQLDRLKHELGDRLMMSGLDIEKYAQMNGKTVEQIEEEMRPEAEKRVGIAMVLTEVAKKEHIEVTAADIDGEVARMKVQYGDPKVQEELDKPEVREDIYNHLMASRAMEKIMGEVSS